jgi:hypothetical protein
MTEPTRRLARAADIELRRRGVLGRDEHLRSAEPEGFVYPGPEGAREVWVQLRLDGSIELPHEPEPLSLAEREGRALEVLGLTLGSDQPELPSTPPERPYPLPGVAWDRARVFALTAAPPQLPAGSPAGADQGPRTRFGPDAASGAEHRREDRCTL